MKVLSALIDIVRFIIPEKIISYRGIIFKLTDNPYYPKPYQQSIRYVI